MRKPTFLILLALAGLFLAGCSPAPTPTPTVIPLPTTTPTLIPIQPTPTPSPTPTSTPLPPSPTPTSTATPIPPSPTSQPPTPTPTPELQGRFVFQVASGGDIYMVNADGTGLSLLTQGLDPVWAPDGKAIAFARWEEKPGIYIMNPGGEERRVFNVPNGRAPAWAPEGGRVAFYYETEGMTPPIRFCQPPYGCFTVVPRRPEQQWKLGVVDLVTGHFSQPRCDRHSFSPVWLPDGKTIAYEGEKGLRLTDLSGTMAPWPLTDNPHDAFPVWSPDGSRVAFMHHQHDHWEIYIMNSDGSGRTRLTETPFLADRPFNNVSPAWSPDGKKIAFLSDRDGPWHLYVMDADGSNQQQILNEVTDRLPIHYGFVLERVISWTN